MTPARDPLDSHPLRKIYPLWNGDPCTLIPTRPLTDEEIEVLRTCDGTPAQLNRHAAEHRTIGLVAHVLCHRPSGGVAFAMIRGSALMCSSTAVLHATGEVVPIEDCNTSVSR